LLTETVGFSLKMIESHWTTLVLNGKYPEIAVLTQQFILSSKLPNYSTTTLPVAKGNHNSVRNNHLANKQHKMNKLTFCSTYFFLIFFHTDQTTC